MRITHMEGCKSDETLEKEKNVFVAWVKAAGGEKVEVVLP